MDLEDRLVHQAIEREAERHPYPLVFATISGAHLYGFPSADSDVDLRGVHVLPLREVVGLKTGPETIESANESEGVLVETVTHDIKKFARLLLKRNGYVLEQVLSPLVVRTSPDHEELKSLAEACITKKHYLHYLGFANNQWKLLQKKPTLKGVLYVYRVLLTGIHLMKTGEVLANLPMLLQGHPVAHVADLMQRKIGGREKSFLSTEEMAFHEAEYLRLGERLEREAESSSLPPSTSAADALNDFVIRVRTIS